MFAMSTLGFDNYVEPLKLYLQKYREATKGDKQSADGYDDLGEDMLGEISPLVFLDTVHLHFDVCQSGTKNPVLVTNLKTTSFECKFLISD